MTRSRRHATLAAAADKFLLYEQAVQDPARDAALLARLFRRSTGRPARVLREDFCGGGAIARAWVARDRRNTAVAVDRDQATLRWAAARAATALPAHARVRLRFLRGDVRRVAERADVLCACNFSYCVFHGEDELGAWLRHSRRRLSRGGILLLDILGGGHSQAELVQRQRLRGVTYVWEQARFDPLRYAIDCRIHFEFHDGSALRDAFVYDWRLWTPPELSRLVRAAGFAEHWFLWQEVGPDGVATGRYRRTQRGRAHASWVAYLVARAPA